MAAVGGIKVIIIGAGLSGLAIAHGLRRNGIAFEIFEKEAVPRDRNWGVTVTYCTCVSPIRD
jgi:cation diffusion facilitator CzcD-associated flavoprotein CzcO